MGFGADLKMTKMNSSHFEQIANIQMSSLSSDVTSRLGKDFLTSFLYHQLLQNDVCSKVAISGDRIIGYIFMCQPRSWMFESLVKRPRSILRFSFRNPFETAGIVITGMMLPSLVNSVEISWIAVSPEYQRCGVGRALIQDCLRSSELNLYSKVWVKTLASTPENIAFYEGCGFEKYKSMFGRVILTHDPRK